MHATSPGHRTNHNILAPQRCHSGPTQLPHEVFASSASSPALVEVLSTCKALGGTMQTRWVHAGAERFGGRQETSGACTVGAPTAGAWAIGCGQLVTSDKPANPKRGPLPQGQGGPKEAAACHGVLRWPKLWKPEDMEDVHPALFELLRNTATRLRVT